MRSLLALKWRAVILNRRVVVCVHVYTPGLLAADMKKRGVEISDENVDAAKDSLRRAQEGCGAQAMREVVLAQQTLG